MPRLFIGIPLTHALSEALLAFRKPYEDIAGIRWVPEANLHITVCFFGDVPQEMISNLISLIQLGMRSHSAFTLSPKQFEFAPPKKDPRMIWLRMTHNEAFLRLNHDISALFTQVNPKLQKRMRPIPHITLARFQQGTFLGDLALEQRSLPSDLYASNLILWESKLEPRGPIYTVIRAFPLSP